MMLRWLPVALFGVIAPVVSADDGHAPGLPPKPSETPIDHTSCIPTRDENACARTLACIGRQGLWFDGQARGWNRGRLAGQRSDGVSCSGTWAYGDQLGLATATLTCTDGVTARILYYAHDSLTGTGLAQGLDSKGRAIRAWTGNNVLKFLGNGHEGAAELPCTDRPVPLG